MKNILFIIGSLRAKSFNRQLANMAKEIIGDRAKVSELDYSDLPLINQDLEQPEPAAVARAPSPVEGGRSPGGKEVALSCGTLVFCIILQSTMNIGLLLKNKSL